MKNAIVLLLSVFLVQSSMGEVLLDDIVPSGTTGNLVGITEIPPAAPGNPIPENGAIDVPVDTQLFWDGGDCSGACGVVNGDFETGTFAGWTLANSTSLGSFVINNGTFDPASPDGPLPPYGGGYSAMSNQTGAGTRTIFQDVVLPSDAIFLTLRWADMIHNHASYFEDPKQEYRVEIRDLNNGILATLFSTNPGDPLNIGWMERSADILVFAGRTVRIAFTEEDNYGFFNVHIDNVRIESKTMTYDVYLGTDMSGLELIAKDLDKPVYTPNTLNHETTYYWQVIARNSGSETAGPVWSFTTKPCLRPEIPADPEPEEGAVDVPIDTPLSWNGGGDCPGTCGVENGGFETGNFAPWVAVAGSGEQLTAWNVGNGSRGYFGNGRPLEGSFCVQNGFDGSAGLYYDLYQETAIPACASSVILTWSERIQWNITGRLPREYTVSIQPVGGGVPLAIIYSKSLSPSTQGDTGYVSHSVDLLDLAPSIAGQTIRINFHESIPETFTGPAQFELDGISLTCGGQILISDLQQAAVVLAEADSRVAEADEVLPADYEQIRQQALIQMAQEQHGQSVSGQVRVMALAAAPAAVSSGGGIINGDFETGTFAGWTLLNSTSSGTFIINNGTFDPASPDGPLPPYGGGYSAMSNQTGPSVCTIFQDVVLPSDATFLTLRWADMIHNHATYFEDPKQEYRVEIRDLNNQILATLFSTNPGDPLNIGWTERSADILAFAGRTVRIAFTEEATYFFFNVHIDNVQIESKIEPINPVTYDVYLGTDMSGLELIAKDLDKPWCAPASDPNMMLLRGRIYHWQVIARNNCSETAGPVWSFSTENTPPVANAGQDFSVHCGLDGTAMVQLDGSASSDADNGPLSYHWNWTIDDQACTAEGVAPTIQLPLGTHEITLIVTDGIANSEPNAVSVTVYNTPPVANAGADITSYLGFKGDSIDVSLDGSGSSDADGDALTYKWYLDEALLTEGVNPTVSLPVGEHTITLIVNDGLEDSQADEVIVTVVGPVRAGVKVLPCVLNLKSHDRYVWIMMDVPCGISLTQLDRKYGYFVLPGEIRPKWVGHLGGRDPKVMARVEREPLREYLHTGRMKLTFYGRLKDGRYLGGSANVFVINPPDKKYGKK